MQALLDKNKQNEEKAKETSSTQATNMIEATINAHEESKKIPDEPQEAKAEKKTSTPKKEVEAREAAPILLS